MDFDYDLTIEDVLDLYSMGSLDEMLDVLNEDLDYIDELIAEYLQ